MKYHRIITMKNGQEAGTAGIESILETNTKFVIGRNSGIDPYAERTLEGNYHDTQYPHTNLRKSRLSHRPGPASG